MQRISRAVIIMSRPSTLTRENTWNIVVIHRGSMTNLSFNTTFRVVGEWIRYTNYHDSSTIYFEIREIVISWFEL